MSETKAARNAELRKQAVSARQYGNYTHLPPNLLDALLDDSEALEKLENRLRQWELGTESQEKCETFLKLAYIDSADDHTHLQEICKKFFPAEKVEGDGYGVPGIMELADMLAARLSENDEEIMRLRDECDALRVEDKRLCAALRNLAQIPAVMQVLGSNHTADCLCPLCVAKTLAARRWIEEQK